MTNSDDDEATRLLEEHDADQKATLVIRTTFLVEQEGASTLVSSRERRLYSELARCGVVNTTWLNDRRVMKASTLVRFSCDERAELLEDVNADLERLHPWPSPPKRLLDLLDA